MVLILVMLTILPCDLLWILHRLFALLLAIKLAVWGSELQVWSPHLQATGAVAAHHGALSRRRSSRRLSPLSRQWSNAMFSVLFVAYLICFALVLLS